MDHTLHIFKEIYLKSLLGINFHLMKIYLKQYIKVKRYQFNIKEKILVMLYSNFIRK